MSALVGMGMTDCATPDDLVKSLRFTAQRFREDSADLKVQWQDDSAGNIWEYAARRLESVADGIEKKWAKT